MESQINYFDDDDGISLCDRGFQGRWLAELMTGGKYLITFFLEWAID